jgi:hypothetical protein
MDSDATHPFLKKAIQGLNASKEFKAMCKANGFKTLSDLLKYPLHELPFLKLSGYRMLKEFLDIMEENNLSDQIDSLKE